MKARAAFAIKAEVRDPREKSFAFTAQKTMYGGKHIAEGDTVFVFASENPSHWTLSLGLASFRGLHHVQWNLTMAATLLVTAPVLLMFLFAQRAFIEGVTLTGVKG